MSNIFVEKLKLHTPNGSLQPPSRTFSHMLQRLLMHLNHALKIHDLLLKIPLGPTHVRHLSRLVWYVVHEEESRSPTFDSSFTNAFRFSIQPVMIIFILVGDVKWHFWLFTLLRLFLLTAVITGTLMQERRFLFKLTHFYPACDNLYVNPMIQIWFDWIFNIEWIKTSKQPRAIQIQMRAPIDRLLQYCKNQFRLYY